MKQFSSDFRNHLCNLFTYTLELAETSRATLSSNQDECLAIIYFPVLSAGYAYSHCVVMVFVFVFFLQRLLRLVLQCARSNTYIKRF